jgi:hypothetical protein
METVVAYFYLLSKHRHGGTDENHEKSQPRNMYPGRNWNPVRHEYEAAKRI